MTTHLHRRAVLVAGGSALLASCRGPEGSVLPDFELPGLPGLETNGWPVPGIRPGQFRGRVSLLNVWASWCPYCQAEHDDLMKLSQDRRFALVGLVFRDKPEAALAYLKRAGNPYAAVAADPDGKFAGFLGQKGVPSSYVVDRAGRITLKIAGELSEAGIRDKLLPAIRQALEAPAASG